MSELRVYAACLASYNAGELHGAWIDIGEIADCATSTDDAAFLIQAKINEMLRASRHPNVTRQDCECAGCRKSWTRTLHYDAAQDRPSCRACKGTGRSEQGPPCWTCNGTGKAPVECPTCGSPATCGAAYPSAEEWAIHDYDGVWPSGMGEYPSLETIAAWAELLQEADGTGVPPEIVKALASHFGEPHGKDPFVCTRDAITDNFSGVHASLGDWAEELESGSGTLDQIPERLRPYLDFDAIGRDARLSGDIFDIAHDGQVWVFWNH